MPILIQRPRRNRKNEAIRSLIQETRLSYHDIVAPLFICEGGLSKEPIVKMPGIFRRGIEEILIEIERLMEFGIKGVALFPQIPSHKKCSLGLAGLDADGLIPQAIQAIKSRFPSITLFCDIALDPYTSHGHDGVLNAHGDVDNDATIESLIHQSLLFAAAGCDVLAPSDMMDGRVGAIRNALEKEHFHDVAILSYAAKYASALYAPFRDAVRSGLVKGDKKTYQMDPANRREALRESLLDCKEGADLLMVKPAGLYLDIISDIKRATLLPLAAYHVSGEYAMVMAAAKENFLDPHEVFYETLLSIKRAGADMIFTYAYDFILPQLGA